MTRDKIIEQTYDEIVNGDDATILWDILDELSDDKLEEFSGEIITYEVEDDESGEE